MPSQLPTDIASEVEPLKVDKSFRDASDPETWNAFQKVAEDLLKSYDVKKFQEKKYQRETNNKTLSKHLKEISESYRTMHALHYSGNDRTHAFIESEKKFTILVDIDGADAKSTKILVNDNTVEVIAKWEMEAMDDYNEILYSKSFTETPQKVSAQITSDGILIVTIPNEASTLKVPSNQPVQSPTKRTRLLERVRPECCTDIPIIRCSSSFYEDPILEQVRYFFRIHFFNFLVEKWSPGMVKDEQLFLDVRKSKVASDYLQTWDSFSHTIVMCVNADYKNELNLTVEEDKAIILRCNTMETSDLIRNCRVCKTLTLDADANLKAATAYLFADQFIFITVPRMIEISRENPKSVVKEVAGPFDLAAGNSLPIVIQGSLFKDLVLEEAKRCFECVAQLAANNSNGIHRNYGMSVLDRNILVHVSSGDPHSEIIVDVQGYQANNLAIRKVLEETEVTRLCLEGICDIDGKVASKHQLRITFWDLPLFLDLNGASANLSEEGLISIKIPRKPVSVIEEKNPLLMSIIKKDPLKSKSKTDTLLSNATAGNLRNRDLIKIFKIHSNISNAKAGGHFYIDKDFEQFRSLFQSALRQSYKRFQNCSAFQDTTDFYKCIRLQRQSAYGSNVAINEDAGDHMKIIFDAISVVQGLSIQILDANHIEISGSYEMEENDYQLIKYNCYYSIQTYFRKIFDLADGFNPFEAVCRISSDRVVCISVPKS